MKTYPEIQNNILNSIHQAFSDTIITLIQQYVSNETLHKKISLTDNITNPLESLAKAEYPKNHSEYGSIAITLLETQIHFKLHDIASIIKTIESTAITCSSLECTPNKNYFCMQVDATKDGETTKFNFLLDLDLVKKLLRGHFNPSSPHILPKTQEFTIDGTYFKISHSVKHQAITLEDVKEYVATSYVGSRVLSLFSRPTPSDAAAIAAPVAAAGAAPEEITFVNNELSDVVRNALIDAHIISGYDYLLK